MQIRNARVDDVKEIYELLDHFADQGLLLGRSLSSLYDQLRDFLLCTEEDGREVIVGVCALHVCWEDLAEIRSLAVRTQNHGQGIGGQLVKNCLAATRELGIARVFTLTYQPDFFKGLAFCPVDKNELPHKVWSDCISCPKFPDCNEEAMIWHATRDK